MTIIVRFTTGQCITRRGVSYFRLNPFKSLFYEWVDSDGWHTDVISSNVDAVEVVR